MRTGGYHDRVVADDACVVTRIDSVVKSAHQIIAGPCAVGLSPRMVNSYERVSFSHPWDDYGDVKFNTSTSGRVEALTVLGPKPPWNRNSPLQVLPYSGGPAACTCWQSLEVNIRCASLQAHALRGRGSACT